MNDQMFELRGRLDRRTQSIIAIGGGVLTIFVWWILVQFHLVKTSIMPSPGAVLQAFPYLLTHNVAGRFNWDVAAGSIFGWHFTYPVLIKWHVWWIFAYPTLELFTPGSLFSNFGLSLRLNLMAYAEAIAIALPLGYLIGLMPPAKAACKWWLDALRYLPLTAALGLFILWFGISTNMKLQFLTLGTLVYLLPAVAVRVDEVDPVYDQTAITLGASKWQRVMKVFVPDVLAAISLDLLNLTAISWTYIIVVEGINRGEGGIGSMFYMAQRQGRVDWIFALLLLLLTFGFVWDKLWRNGDRRVFPYKYLRGNR